MSPFCYALRHEQIHARRTKGAIAWVSLSLPYPPSPPGPDGPVRSFPWSYRFLPHRHPQRNHDLIRTVMISTFTDKNTSDDVSANKSLNGNECETPSTRTPDRRAGASGPSDALRNSWSRGARPARWRWDRRPKP